MTQYRQILRLHSQGISQRRIAQSCGCSRNTVAAVLQRASAANLTWPLDVETDADLERLLFPEKQAQVSLRRMPDFEKVSKELTRSGVTHKLLWMEYCEECRQLGEQPFMYSQFCYHFQKFAEKERSTMHIPRKPGDRIEVDWAGDKLYMGRCGQRPPTMSRLVVFGLLVRQAARLRTAKNRSKTFSCLWPFFCCTG